jgi:hypothetical protein
MSDKRSKRPIERSREDETYRIRADRYSPPEFAHIERVLSRRGAPDPYAPARARTGTRRSCASK